MLTRQQIIKALRKMHCREEPLNITAVKRYHPELIQAVYAAKPFWGWKQALKDAGLDYANIEVELQATISCALCGKLFRNLASHLKHKHGVDSEEYLMDYPDSDLMCEELRADRTIRQNKFLPHWEPAWSREYILDRVAEFHRQGYSMNYIDIQKVDPQLTGVVDHSFDEGTWGNVLTMIGMDPLKLRREIGRRHRRYPDKKAVIQAIKQRLKKGVRVIPYSFLKGRWREATLLRCGMEYFGSWPNALKAAGLDLKEALKRKGARKYQTKDDIIAGIRARQKRNWPLSIAEVIMGNKKRRECMLGVYGTKYFGSWAKALKAAGIDPKEYYRQLNVRRRKYPDANKVLQGIKQRIKRGRRLNSSALLCGPDRDIPLWRWAETFFGSWYKALKVAGLDPGKVQHEARSKAAHECHRLRRMTRAMSTP